MKTGWFVRGDIDGFFGLFVDNLLQLMLIAVLCTQVCGMPPELVYGRIMPGAALSILFGNIFYTWQARCLAVRTGRSDVTALPYGINTVSLIAFVFLIIAPIYFETKDPNLAWQAGLFACLASAVLECIGAFAGDWLRRHTPRAAWRCWAITLTTTRDWFSPRPLNPGRSSSRAAPAAANAVWCPPTSAKTRASRRHPLPRHATSPGRTT